MKRNKIMNICWHDSIQQHRESLAFHEAGHAAAIYLNNKQKHLPPVYFQIIFKELSQGMDYGQQSDHPSHADSVARVEGGRLIQTLSCSIDAFSDNLSDRKLVVTPLDYVYQLAFKADIVNLLAGPLAEAKHVHHRDDEVFNCKLASIDTLQKYGGESDLELVREYLECFSEDKQKQDHKLHELFIEANDFINDYSNWNKITKLAAYIIESDKNIISYEEIVSEIDS